MVFTSLLKNIYPIFQLCGRIALEVIKLYKKDAKYTFMLNKEQREKFKMYCKIMKVSPSDMLCEVVYNFNEDVDRIIEMKDMSEIQDMLQGKFNKATEEISLLKAERKNQ